jgi:Fe-S cluster assembly iron-binding protein IscA
MTLYESADGLNKLESNGVEAYIDQKLYDYLSQIGDINVDYIDAENSKGFMIKIGEGNCGDCKCS